MVNRVVNRKTVVDMVVVILFGFCLQGISCSQSTSLTTGSVCKSSGLSKKIRCPDNRSGHGNFDPVGRAILHFH